MFTIDLRGKTGLVMGVTNQRSIAWSIAQPLADAGARLAFSYQGERLKPTLDDLTKDMDDPILAECDVTDDAQLDALFARLKREFGRLDFVVHAIAYAPRARFPSRSARRARGRLAPGDGRLGVLAGRRREPGRRADGRRRSDRDDVVPGRRTRRAALQHDGRRQGCARGVVRYLAYDLGPAGVRVNALSAGPVRTVAARSIAGFGDMYGEAGKQSMLKRNITTDEVGRMGFALVTDLAGGVTGETVHVDAGFHAIGMFLGRTHRVTRTRRHAAVRPGRRGRADAGVDRRAGTMAPVALR